MQIDNMLEKALINKEWLLGVLLLFHIRVHFQMKTSSYFYEQPVSLF